MQQNTKVLILLINIENIRSLSRWLHYSCSPCFFLLELLAAAAAGELTEVDDDADAFLAAVASAAIAISDLYWPDFSACARGAAAAVAKGLGR